MTTLQTLEMALKDLEDANNTAYAEFSIDNLYGETITKLRQQIALEKMAENERELGIQMQPDEPVAWMYEFGTDHCDAVTPVRWYKNVTSLEKPDPEKSLVRNVVPLYTRPQPAAQWVGLTDEEIDAILKRGDVAEHDAWNGRWYVLPYSFSQSIEAKLKEKNGG